MDSQGEESLLPPREESPRHHQPQAQLQHQELQQQFVGFGIDPNWGGFGQMMHAQPGYHLGGVQPGSIDGQLIPGPAPSMSMDPLEALLGPFPCARVRGLPFEATLEDVLVFFQGLVVIDVVLVPIEDSGEAYVLFANPMDFQMGLQRDRQNIGNRYVEIFHGKRADYYAAIAAQHHHWNGDGGLLENEGMAAGHLDMKPVVGTIPGAKDPLHVDGEGVQSFHGEEGAWSKPGAPSPIHNNTAHKGRGPGSANGGLFRGRGGYSHGGRGGNYRRAYKGNSGGGGHHGGGIRDGLHTGFIRMRGLPFQATKQDILDFFKDFKPIESSVLLTYRVDGRATGEGYVAFDDAEIAKDAMTMHRSTIGSRYIELFISNKEEHTRNVARAGPR